MVPALSSPQTCPPPSSSTPPCRNCRSHHPPGLYCFHNPFCRSRWPPRWCSVTQPLLPMTFSGSLLLPGIPEVVRPQTPSSPSSASPSLRCLSLTTSLKHSGPGTRALSPWPLSEWVPLSFEGLILNSLELYWTSPPPRNLPAPISFLWPL